MAPLRNRRYAIILFWDQPGSLKETDQPVHTRPKRKGRSQRKTAAESSKQVKRSSRKTKKKTNNVPVVKVRDIPSASKDSQLSSSNECDEYKEMIRNKSRNSDVHLPGNETEYGMLSQREKKMKYKWRDTKLQKSAESVEFTGSAAPLNINLDSPKQFFQHFFTGELVQEIAKQTALYATQNKPERPPRITAADIKQFIGICLYM